ncbi:alpha-L-fucosidase [Pedobacter aquatilis]|uniref:alpha-L-fucosidase n=1 Tax=Pedobacter aquatilis TaxID=351343 RepID=UPI00292D7E2B|nr:alpha-L-fucosidase [Pedobacter aquatilis]
MNINKSRFQLSILFFSLFLNFSATLSWSQTGTDQDKKMGWWREARFGMFVHWGVYSIWGGEYHGELQRRSGAEWIMNRCKIGVSEYKLVASGFNPIKFNADSLVLLAKRSGMKYIVFTAKHHDGFAMFKSEASTFNIMDYTPFKRDIVGEIAAACSKHGMKLGLYYSQSQDWVNPGGAALRRAVWEGWANPDSTSIDNYTLKNNGHWDYLQMRKGFDDYIHQIALPQIKEILSNYGDIASIWFDTPAEITDAQATEIANELKKYPNIIVNDRLKRPNFLGDFRTSEQKLPGEELEGVHDVETCMTLNSSWGYKRPDTNWKSPEKVIKTLISASSEGGNFLLNIGPQPDGLIPAGSIKVLNAVGAWMKTNGESIYGTTKAPLAAVRWGKIAIKNRPQNREMFLYVFDMPENGLLNLPAKIKIKEAKLIASSEKLKFTSGENGLISISLPSGKMAKELIPVVKLTLAQSLSPVRSVQKNTKTSKIVDQ